MHMSSVVEQSFDIAWGILAKSGEISRPDATATFLLESVRTQMRMGEFRPLIEAWRAHG